MYMQLHQHIPEDGCQKCDACVYVCACVVCVCVYLCCVCVCLCCVCECVCVQVILEFFFVVD